MLNCRRQNGDEEKKNKNRRDWLKARGENGGGINDG